jgi:hypothetical protein
MHTHDRLCTGHWDEEDKVERFVDMGSVKMVLVGPLPVGVFEQRTESWKNMLTEMWEGNVASVHADNVHENYLTAQVRVEGNKVALTTEYWYNEC